jgi:L-ascorbate metabolism protein UlaG (beta-lactamase superfamily)
MIEPALKDDAFLADVAAARARVDDDRLYLWWLGQSGFLVCYRGECLIFDPYLSDALTTKYAATDKPHIRMTARVVDPARLDFITIITSSHNHTDHLDAETLRPILAASTTARIVVAEANRQFVEERLGAALTEGRLVALDAGARVTICAYCLETVPAAHEELAPEFVGFVATVGRFRIYHSGDTVLFPGMEERLRPFGIDVALLPINGRAAERRVSGNLDGAEAAGLARAIGARWVIPCHYDMFTFNTASPDAFAAECARLDQRAAVLKAGERWVLS